MPSYWYISIIIHLVVWKANCRYLQHNTSINQFQDIFSSKAAVTECIISINGDLPNPQPLFIIPNTLHFFQPQDRDGRIRLRRHEAIELFCSRSFDVPFNGTQTLLVTCANDNLFLVNDTIDKSLWPISALRCTHNVDFPTARATNVPCGGPHNSTLIDIGYDLSATRRLPLMRVCHNTHLHRTHYTQHQLGAANIAYQRGVARPSRFVSAPFFAGLPVDRMYTKAAQMQTIAGILGAERIPAVFDENRSVYLARGHLAAKVDYIFGAQQRGTFHFVNAAPQWQSFNAGNWEAIESDVRQMVADRRLRNVTVFTGTWQVLRLPDVDGVERELYLGFVNGHGVIPVPAFYYKVLVDAASRRGVALVGVNNPHATPAQLGVGGEYRLCPDVSPRLGSWMRRWQPAVVRRGFAYACDVNEFRRVVNELPTELRTGGLLE